MAPKGCAAGRGSNGIVIDRTLPVLGQKHRALSGVMKRNTILIGWMKVLMLVFPSYMREKYYLLGRGERASVQVQPPHGAPSLAASRVLTVKVLVLDTVP
jgi:hypothetical protein